MSSSLPDTMHGDKFNICLPKLAKYAGCSDGFGLSPVRPRIPRHLQVVNRFGRYLSREQGYDFPLEWDDENGESRAYFFTSWRSLMTVTTIQPVGCAVFQKYSSADPWQFEWAWIHPYERGRGHMTNAWPKFKEEFGDFTIQQPLSFGMKVFLTKLINKGQPTTKAIRAALRWGDFSPEAQAEREAESKEVTR
jgi:hypothetical protein